MNRRNKPRKEKSPQEQRSEALEALLMRLDTDEYLRAAITAQNRKKEEAHLALATALLELMERTGMGYRRLAEAMNGCVDHTTIQKVCMRSLYLKRERYLLVCGEVNRLRGGLSLNLIDFSTWKEWRDFTS